MNIGKQQIMQMLYDAAEVLHDARGIYDRSTTGDLRSVATGAALVAGLGERIEAADDLLQQVVEHSWWGSRIHEEREVGAEALPVYEEIGEDLLD